MSVKKLDLAIRLIMGYIMACCIKHILISKISVVSNEYYISYYIRYILYLCTRVSIAPRRDVTLSQAFASKPGEMGEGIFDFL